MTDHHWFVDVADTLGTQYLRYSFTRGTVQEVDFLIDELGLTDADRILDVGCGPGRHVRELGVKLRAAELWVHSARNDQPDDGPVEAVF